MSAIPTPKMRGISALAGMALITCICWVALAAYQGKFLSTVSVTLHTSKAGLGVLPGTKVMLHGVQVGRVTSVSIGGTGDAVLQAAIEQNELNSIPNNVFASIDATTVFGPKVVSLTTPKAPSTQHLAQGDVIQAGVDTPEIDDLFTQINRLLTTVNPETLNVALTGVGRALHGRGTEIGQLVSNLRKYVTVLNAHLPAIDADIARGASVAQTYADATPNVIGALKNVTRTAQTLIAVAPNLHTFLLSLATSSAQIDSLVRASAQPFVGTLNLAAAPLNVLGLYAPEFPCLIEGLNYDRLLVQKVVGTKYAAIQASDELLPGQSGYRYPANLPKLTTGVGPHCYGLPIVSPATEPAPHVLFNDGTSSIWTNSPGNALTLNTNLSDALFGQNLTDLLASLGLGAKK